MIHFEISGVETYWWLPIVVAYIISAVTSLGGLSGAFMLLPFQVSFLGYTGPGVSPTNLLYNVISTPTGIWRYAHERRMVWPIAWAVILGTLPGVLIGAWIRLTLLPDPAAFKLFVGCVLLLLAIRLLLDQIRPPVQSRDKKDFQVSQASFSLSSVAYRFSEADFRVATWKIILLSLVVGLIGGAYGIGGAAIIVPFLVGAFGLPVHTVAGAALLGNFVTSAVGVASYLLLVSIGVGEASEAVGAAGGAATPDWLLGLLFGIGGAAGTYTGARLQKKVSARSISWLLIVSLLGIAGSYIWQFFFA